MSLTIDHQTTGLFTVVGGPFVAEHHADSKGQLWSEPATVKVEERVAALWLSAYAACFGIALLACGAVKAFTYASAFLS